MTPRYAIRYAGQDPIPGTVRPGREILDAIAYPIRLRRRMPASNASLCYTALYR
jgi:hypothetical protein